MSKDTPQIAAARIEAERARARMMSSAYQLQERISPKVLARDAWEGAKMKGADLVEDSVDAVKRNPGTAGGVAAAAMLFLLRQPLMDLAGKVSGGVKTKAKARKSRKKSEERDLSEQTETTE
jgi:hypothetical protein